MAEPSWITLQGAANARDLGGLPTVDGRRTVAGRLIRTANLQRLTPADVRYLVDDLGVRSVVDLRTGVEVDSEGPGPLATEPLVRIEHLSLFPEVGRNTDAAAVESDAPVLLPWQNRDTDLGRDGQRGASGVYLGYLVERPDSVLAALRLVATPDGATIVHCAAGKDRTGTVIALALAEVGVEPEAIVADYAASAVAIENIFASLAASSTYAGDMVNWDYAKHTPRAITMERMLAGLDSEFGGAGGWLRKNGWTDEDAQALQDRLLEP